MNIEPYEHGNYYPDIFYVIAREAITCLVEFKMARMDHFNSQFTFAEIWEAEEEAQLALASMSDNEDAYVYKLTRIEKK